MRTKKAFSKAFLKGNGQDMVLNWPTYNFMQQARMKLQLLTAEGNDSWISVGYVFIFFILVIDTLIYTYTYIKRVIYMAFLTLIAPLVALTYPIDKVNDGKAQAFDMWFKEYMFNLLIQPLHLLLYMILVGSAMSFAAKNPIYAVIAIGFMIPAEKLLRQFFGFQKASTPGFLPGLAGGALMMQGISKLTGWGPHGAKDNPKSNEIDSKENKGKIKIRSVNPYDRAGITPPALTPPIGTTPMGTTPVGTTPIGTTPVGTTPIGTTPIGTTPIGTTPVGTTPIGTTPVGTTPIGTTPTTTNKKPNRALGVANAYLNSLGRKRKIKQPYKNAARFAGKVFGGALGAGVGLAIGAATGDPSKAFQNTVIGTKGGMNLGGGTADFITDNISDFTTIDGSTKAAVYGDNYKEHLMKQQKKEWKANKENMDILRINLGEEKYEELMDNKGAILDQYLETGITDAADIFAAEKFRNDHPGTSVDQAIANVKIANAIGHYKDMSKEDKDKAKDTLTANFAENNPGLNSAQIGALVDNQVKFIDEIYSTKGNLKY